MKNKKIREPKYKYSFNSKLYDVEVNSSFEEKVGATRANPEMAVSFSEKTKANSSLTLEKIKKNRLQFRKISATSEKKPNKLKEHFLKLPQIYRLNLSSLEQQAISKKKVPNPYYQMKVYRSFKSKQNSYMMNLARQHFIQSVQAIRIGKNVQLSQPKQIKLPKKTPKFKTVFLDLDETLVHCDEEATNYTTKLNFPIEGGSTIAAGVRVRPHCQEFLKQLSSFAEIIIFTASSASYADVVLNYLDPNKKFFSHRLYRQHCTLHKGFYTKDLRLISNRRPEDIVLVDNSAFCFMSQPSFGVPILPFYHFTKDKELLGLLEYLKELVKEDDMRRGVQEAFGWNGYLEEESDPRKIFMREFGDE